MSKTNQEYGKLCEKKIVLPIPDSVVIPVRQDIVYRSEGTDSLKMDIYYPPQSKKLSAVVIFVTGFRDAGYQRLMGCKQKEMGSYCSWARRLAHSGMAAVLYENRDPVGDAHQVLTFVSDNADALSLDRNQIALWACSGNVPNGLSLLRRREQQIRCAVFCYGYFLDDHSSSCVAETARRFGFVTPQEEDAITEIPSTTPFLIVRAGEDQMPGLLTSSDDFLALALRKNVPVSLINHAKAPHAFDLDDNSEDSRRTIRQIVSYLKNQLCNGTDDPAAMIS